MVCGGCQVFGPFAVLALPRLGSRTDDDSSMVNIFSLNLSLLAVSYLCGTREGSLSMRREIQTAEKRFFPRPAPQEEDSLLPRDVELRNEKHVSKF